MSLGHGTKIVTEGLVLQLDPAGLKSGNIPGTAYTGNSVVSSDIFGNSFAVSDGMYVTGKDYYTLYGLTYPESSQTPASRDGVTPGISNTSAAKQYDASRDVNYYVFDEDTNTWIANSYFNGERIDGHCYDTYDGQPNQHATFQADFDNIVSTFPNATHIVIGSHASENVDNSAETFSRLQKIGMPDDQLGLGRAEFVLVGKYNKPSTWEFTRENVSTAVATMNVGLPLSATKQVGWRFTQQSHSIVVSPDLYLPVEKTLSFWIRSNRPLSATDNWEIGFVNQGSTVGTMFGMMYGVGNCQDLGFWGYGSNYDLSVESVTNKWSSDGNWHQCTITMDPSRNVRVWIDGEQKQWLKHSDYSTLVDSVAMPTDTTNKFVINSRGAWNGGMSYVDVGNVLVYEVDLTAEEIKQNYEATKGRFQ